MRRIEGRVRLAAGVLAPILFTLVYFVEGATRPGYDPMRHQVSLLSLGDGGWVQVASFLVTGALLAVFASGLRQSLDGAPGGRAAPLALALSGVGFLLAGLFSTQPLFGYPPGTPEGMPADVTPASLLHVLGAGLLFFGLVAAAVAMAHHDRRTGHPGRSKAPLLVAVIVLVTFGASGGGPSGQLLFPAISGLLQRVALLVGLGWVLAVAVLAIQDGANAARDDKRVSE
jgi:hypothetical protein